MAAKLYRQYQQDVAPFWARQPRGANFWESLGKKKDETAAIAQQAVSARFASIAPIDALEQIGHERGLPRYDLSAGANTITLTPQTDAEYRATLIDAWSLWYWGGTAKGMLDELYRAYAPYTAFRIITQQGRIWSRAVDGTISFVDSGAPYAMGPISMWNTFQVWFTLDAGSNMPWSPIPDNNSQDANTVRAIIEAWRPGHARCHSIVIAIEGDEPWGYPGDLAGGVALTWGVTGVNWGSFFQGMIWSSGTPA